MAAVPKIRWRVAATEKEGPAWCIPLADGSSVGDLTRAVEIRENMLRQEAGEPRIVVGIQLKVDGELCAVHPSDLLQDLVPEHAKEIVFVAIRKGGKSVVSAAPAPAPVAAPVAAPAAPATPAPAGGKGVALLDPMLPSSNNQKHADQPSGSTPAGRQGAAGAGCGRTRAPVAPAASSEAAKAGTSPAFAPPSAPFRPPESSTSSGSPSKPSASLKTSSAPSSPAPFASKPAPAAAPSAGNDDVEYMTQDGDDDEDDVVCLGVSGGASSSGAAFSPRPSKRTGKAGKDPQLLPRAAIESQQQAAATIVLAAATLCGGTPTQKSQAEAFVASELADHDKNLTAQLVDSLRNTVKVIEDGIWVRMKKVHGLCGTYQSDKGFFCLTRYIFSDAYPAPSIHARKSSECLDSAYWNVAGDEGSGSLLERWQIDDERVFKWTDDVVCLGGADGDGAAAFSGSPRKKTRVTGSSHSQLQPRSALATRAEAAMTLILAAAMLSGGTSSQRREAEAFVKAELAGHHRRGTSGRLIEGLKSAVEMDGDGVLVGRLGLANLCKISDFYGVTRYLLGHQMSKEPFYRVQAAQRCFRTVQEHIMSADGGPFEVWEKDGRDVFKWLNA